MASFLAAQLSDVFKEVSTWSVSKLVAVSTLSGVTSHIAFFVHGELDYLAQQLFLGLFLVPASIFAVFAFHLGIPILQSSITTATIWISFLLGLTASILTYRLFLHPLRKFPGPVMARTSKLWGVAQTAKSFQYHYLVRDLHQKYGDFVRLGPRELSITSEAAVAQVVRCGKGPWYNLGLPNPGTHLTRSRETHKVRRRIWDRAFTDSAIKEYLPGIIIRSAELLSILAGKEQPINITDYCNYYMWDSMGDVSFSKSFKMLPTHGKEDHYMHISRASQAGVVIFGHMPYIPRILDLFPFLNREYKSFLKWCDDLAVERKKWNPEKKDLFSWLLSADSKGAVGTGAMVMETRTAILAGTDTTAATLATIFFYLANDQQSQRKLQEEIDALYSTYHGDEEKLFKELAFGSCPNTQHLEGVIREALRVNVVVPMSPQRMAPPEGLIIDGRYIPGGTVIYLSQFVTARDPRYFERPTEFIPERWYKPEEYPLTHKQKVFLPFWTGTWSCVGKPYAYMHLRIVTARVIRKFSLELAEGTNEEKIFKEAVDMFIVYLGKIELMLKERNM